MEKALYSKKWGGEMFGTKTESETCWGGAGSSDILTAHSGFYLCVYAIHHKTNTVK